MEKEDIKQEIEYLEKKLNQLHKYVQRLDEKKTQTPYIKNEDDEIGNIYSKKQNNNNRRKLIC